MRQLSRLAIAAWMFSLCCLLSSARLLFQTGIHPADQNHVSRRSEERFAALKPALPERGVVGYIGSPDATVSDYYLAQYALAPLVLDQSPAHPLIVGNFPSSPPNISAQHLRVVRDFGNGVLLLAPEEHQ